MSNLTQEEVDCVLLQLIEQTAPEKPTADEAYAVVRWAEAARIESVILEMVLTGEAQVRIVDGKPHFKLTPQGMAGAEKFLASSPEARALHDRVVADSLGKPLSKGPDEEQ